MNAKKKDQQPEQKDVVVNRKARHDYHILDRVEAGIALQGSEVKALREGKGQLRDAFAMIDAHGQPWMRNCHISEYSHAAQDSHDPRRPRRLLLHRKEINRLGAKVAEKGFTLVPLRIYFTRGRAKVELGLCKGKREYDKRETIKRRQMDRDTQSAMRRAQKRG